MKRVYLVAAALLFTVCLPASAQGMLEIQLTAKAERYRADMPVDLEVTITNVSENPVRVLNYHTPIEGIEHDILSVSLEKEPVQYMGRLYKRRAPTEKDYVTLEPGKSITGIASLWDNYDLSVSGRYSVQYNTEVLSLESGKESPKVVSNVLSLDIEGREPRPDPDDDGDEKGIVNGSNEKFKSCSGSEQSDLINAREHALNYADDAYDYLMAGSVTSRYTTWFGTFDSSRYGTVRDHFKKIRDAVDNETFKYYCNCNKSGVYAFVRPWESYKIHLCEAFWDASMTGDDSKAGTLIHEVSHFWSTASTGDKKYGHTDSMSLATNHPNKAIHNADSHEYFAEETPYSPYNPCAPAVQLPNGSQLAATWDGANCHVMNIPSGATPFVLNNSYYVNALAGSSCPSPSWYDSANCYILTYPSWNPSYFVWSGNLYLTAGPNQACPAPSVYDGANCYVMPLPWGSSPFKYANNLYITPAPNCPAGSFDGAHCYIGTAPSSRNAFIWGSSFYYHH